MGPSTPVIPPIRLHSSAGYWGKHEETLPDVLGMALAARNLPCPPHLACLTLRPFSFHCPLEQPTLWLAPHLSAWEGMQRALDFLGVPYRACLLAPDESDAGWEARLTFWLTDGPVIVGPLDRTTVWNRLPSRYYQGSAYTLLVWGRTERGDWRVHDPEGCPSLHLSPSTLARALRATRPPQGFLQLYSPPAPTRRPDWGEVFAAGWSWRQQGPVGSEALYALATLLATRDPRASEWAALYYALPALALAIGEVAALVAELHPSLPLLPAAAAPLLTALHHFQVACAQALATVIRRDAPALSRALHTLGDCDAGVNLAWRSLLPSSLLEPFPSNPMATGKTSPLHLIDSDLSLSDAVLREAGERFGTPLYLYDGAMLKQSWARLCAALPPTSQLYYSIKANPNVHLVRYFHALGASIEVASAGELAIARTAGVAGEQIIFVGPGKREAELTAAVRYGLRAIVVESPRELDILERLAQRDGAAVRVALRVNPGRGGGQVSMGGATQFGMAREVVRELWVGAEQWPALTFVGLHGYLGTGILEWTQIEANSRLLAEVARELQASGSRPLTFLDVGGGFGIPYYPHQRPLDLASLRPALVTLGAEVAQACPHLPGLSFESGRFLVGPSGVFLSQILDIKSNGGKTFVILDGGINVFTSHDSHPGVRPQPIRVVGSTGGDKSAYTLCGPLCTSTDRLAADVLLPPLKRGDLIAVYQAGAYGPTASPGLFLSHGFPDECLWHAGSLYQIRRSTPLASLLADSDPLPLPGVGDPAAGDAALTRLTHDDP